MSDTNYDRDCPICDETIEHEPNPILDEKEMPQVEAKLADDKLKHHIRNEHSKLTMLVHSVRMRLPL